MTEPDQPSKSRLQLALCQKCLGIHLANLVHVNMGDDGAQTTTVVLVLALGRQADLNP